MVFDAAQFRSEMRRDQDPEHPADCWMKTQDEIDRVLKKHRTRS
jgi:hypothetical protein